MNYSRLNPFHKCSRPWFGQFCEFQFDEDRSLSDMVKFSFFSKAVEHETDKFEVTNLTCYKHLNCYIGPEPLCLDWRDICDGQIDCIDDGADERDCVELEMNMCDADQLLYHNGQCIPRKFDKMIPPIQIVWMVVMNKVNFPVWKIPR